MKRIESQKQGVVVFFFPVLIKGQPIDDHLAERSLSLAWNILERKGCRIKIALLETGWGGSQRAFYLPYR